MSKHTPGPWSRDKYGHIMASGKEVNFRSMSILCSGASERIDEADANTTLASSAPDLFEALEGLLDRYTSLVNCGDCGYWNPEAEEEVIASRAAIAKARGEA